MDQNRESKQQQQPRKKIQKKRPSIDGPNISIHWWLWWWCECERRKERNQQKRQIKKNLILNWNTGKVCNKQTNETNIDDAKNSNVFFFQNASKSDLHLTTWNDR